MSWVDRHRGLTASQRDWLRHREHLQRHRYELGRRAVELYPDGMRVAGTPLLTRPEWLPAEPIPLDAIDLDFTPHVPCAGLVGDDPRGAGVRPERVDGSRCPTYSAAMAEFAAPSVFENRSTYRLLSADLSGPRGRLAFGRGSYFDGIDVGEASAHEYAAARLNGSALPLRTAIGDPCDPTRRPMNLAISALTVRHDRTTGEATFLLHWRDPAKVGHAGGLHMVIPVGIFQASSDQPWNERNDFSLWRCMLREYAEELRGESEDHGSDHVAIDYDSHPFFARMTEARRAGEIRAWVLGLGVDPLTLATDLLAVVVFDAAVFDDLFSAAGGANAEGDISRPIPLVSGEVERFTVNEPMQAAGAATLSLAPRVVDDAIQRDHHVAGSVAASSEGAGPGVLGPGEPGTAEEPGHGG